MPYRTRCFPLSQYNSLHWLFPGSSRFCTHTGSSFISHSSSNVSGSLLGCGMVSILSISSLKSAYVAAHDTGAVSLFQVSKIRLLYSSCNISASIGLMVGPASHCPIQTIFTPRFPVHCADYFFYFSTFCAFNLMLILLAHASTIRAIVRFGNFHSGRWANQKSLLVDFCILVILAIFTEHHIRNVGGGDSR